LNLALGSAQFGLDYGVSNSDGQTSQSETRSILALARNLGVEILDTAAEYGQSESILGDIGVDSFRVITKLPPKLDSQIGVEVWVRQSLNLSLKKLRINSAYGLLLHRSEQLEGSSGKQVIWAVNELKAMGLIKKFGVSIYDPSELELVTQVCIPDIVQAPINVLDRRLITSGWLKRLNQLGTEVHARSVFLQGLLLLPRHKVPEKFKPWAPLFDEWHSWLLRHKADPLVICLAAVSSLPIDSLVFGVNKLDHLIQIVDAAKKASSLTYPNLICEDLNLIKPSNWNAL
jgi:hypothetical protein